MTNKVPAIINVTGLVDALNASPTRAKNLKYKIYYLLSLLTDTNDNYRLNDSNDGYHNICSSEIKKVLGSKDFYVIRELLLNPVDPIIETDNSWHNPNGGNSSGYCQGYRITPKYNTGEVVFKTIPKKLSRVIAKYADKDTTATDAAPDYKFLLDQFESNALSFDPKVYEYVYNFGNQLLLKVEDSNQNQILRIHNLIGRWLYYIEQIAGGNLWRQVSDRNHRLNSSVTNLPKLLRPFLLCNGAPMECVDISSSQPYILSSVMNVKFYNDCNNGYNLSTIYPELYKILVDKIKDSSITYSNNMDILYYSSNTCYTNSFISNVSNSSSFMWCNFFSPSELECINRYTQSPFYLDFYSYILDRYYTYTNTPKSAAKTEDRENLKNTMMYVLFEDKMNHRNNNLQIQKFQKVFPGVDNWINRMHLMVGKRRFSHLLQRAESYLLLNVICREFNELHPNAPLLTIHDGVFTTSEYVKKLNGFILRRLLEITGVVAGCKIKSSQIDPIPHLKDIDNQWSKIEPINTEEKYLKKINGVFSSNIKRGSDFLENFGRNFLNGIDDQI